MTKLLSQGSLVVIALSAVVVAQQGQKPAGAPRGAAQQAQQPAGPPSRPQFIATLPLGTPGPNIPAGKAPEQGYVPDGWFPHEGSLLKYRVNIRWGFEPESMPEGTSWGRVSDVATDAQGNVYVFQRGTHAEPICIFDADGKYLRGFGKGMFGSPHGIRIDKEGNIWTVDTVNQQVLKFTNDGKLLQSWGELKVAGNDERHFARPTNLAWDSKGNWYLTDGYGNGRVVKFDASGKFVKTWGTWGEAPGEFHLPHVVAIDSKDRIYVSDRENNRIQIFDTEGNLLKVWTHLGSTQAIVITPKDEMWINTHRNNTENITYDTIEGRLMKIDLETGKILGGMECPGHGMAVGPNGDIYVASLTGNVFRWRADPKWPVKAVYPTS
jgi:streptogramin lyase